MRRPVPRALRRLVFFQNGPAARKADAVPLDGQGHVTCVHLGSSTVTEVHVPLPAPAHRASLTDVARRPWLALLLLAAGSDSHTGTCNTAVVQRDGRFLAVEEGSRPFEIRLTPSRAAEPVGWVPSAGLLSPHGGEVDFCYRASALRPLSVRGAKVGWAPWPRPPLVHSAVRAGGLLLFPIMPTRLGRWAEWLTGATPLPLSRPEKCSATWLVVREDDLSDWFEATSEAADHGDPFHAFYASSNGTHASVFACHVAGFADLVASPSSASLSFVVRKDVIDVASRRVVESVVFDEAAGDFPNRVDERTFVIHSMRRNRAVLFDVERERVVRRISLPDAGARDVLHHEGYLLYCTRSALVAYCLASSRVVCRIPVPERAESGFHASVFELEE